MGVSALLVLVLSGIRGHVSLSFGILRSMRMEEATTKASEDDNQNRFGEKSQNMHSKKSCCDQRFVVLVA